MSVKNKGRSTAKELLRLTEDVPQATLYRYLRRVVADGLLEVVEENHIRNLREKVYGLAIDLDAEIDKMNNDTTGRVYVAQFKRFINGLVDDFDKNTPKDNTEAVYDGSGFFITPFYATYDEVKDILCKINDLIKPYEHRTSPDRQLRSIATIFTPPIKNTEELK
jgi:hypothetical protein